MAILDTTFLIDLMKESKKQFFPWVDCVPRIAGRKSRPPPC